MTIERQDILSDFYSGNDKDIQVTITNLDGSAKDLSGSEITYSLFSDDGLIFLTKSSLYPAEIEITNPSGGVCLIHLLSQETVSLVGTFRHHVNVVDAMGYEETVLTGRVNIFKSFARRFRKNIKPAYLIGG